MHSYLVLLVNIFRGHNFLTEYRLLRAEFGIAETKIVQLLQETGSDLPWSPLILLK